MAIENTYLLGKNITLGCGFDLQAKAPLDSRQTVPAFAGLQALIDNNATYEGMIVYDEETKKTYQAQMVDGALAFREFGINESELKALIASETTAAMEFKGAATALPENPSKGDMYKVTAAFKVGEEDVKVGDSIVYDGEQWFIIPSGDDIEDTWRPVTDVDNDSTLTFATGNKLDVAVATDGTITYSHETIDAPTNMNEEGDERTRTYITRLITDNYGHVIGFKTATENVEDTNTEYTFEGQSDEATSVYFQVTSNEDGASAEVIYLDAYSKNETDGKFVAKETGKSLIDDDEIARLANIDNYDDEEIRGMIDVIDNHSHDNKAALDEITVDNIVNWNDAVSKEHTHSFLDSDVEDVISKKHSHTFVESELNKIADGDVAKWNIAEQNAKDYADNQIENLALGTMSKETADDYVKKSDATGYGDILTKTEAYGAYQPKGDYAAGEHDHSASEITDFTTEVAKVKVGEASKADTAAKVDNTLTVTVCEENVVFDGSEAKTVDIDAAIEAALTSAMSWGSF